MDTAGYVALSRQSGLLKEMRIIANNVANMNTNGFRGEDLIFSEHIRSRGGDDPSTSMGNASTRRVQTGQGTLQMTHGAFDLAIEGKGYFLIQTMQGEELTRSGHFFVDGASRLVTADGYPVMDIGGSPILVPEGEAGPIGISKDGTMSQNGRPIAQLAIVDPINELGLRRTGESRFAAPDGWEPVENTRVMQGFLEGSNVNAMEQISRMIEVQRAYELGQSLMEKENKRIQSVIETLRKR